MRFILYLTLLIAVLPIVLTRPFFGLCVYYVVSLLQPKLLCWHADFQDAMLVGVPLVVGAFAFGVKRIALASERDPHTGKILSAQQKLVRNPLFEPSWQIAVFVLLILYISITRLLTPFPISEHSYYYRSLCKVLFVVVLLTGLASDLRRFRILYIVVALATAFWAIKGGIKVILLGPHQVYGKSYDNNLFALSSVMVLPMVFYFGLSVKHARWRAVLLVLSALICLGIIGSRSRAGFIAFAVVLTCMAWSSKYRLKGIFAVLLVGAVSIVLSGREILERVESIKTYQQSGLADSRLYTWAIAWDLFRENPLIGVGFKNYKVAKNALSGGKIAAHNIYLQNLAELGLLGHPLWLAIILGTLLSLYKFMHRSRRFPPDMRWAYYWSRGLLLGMFAFCIHGMFHNEEYLELMFVIVGLSIALKVTTRRELWHRHILSSLEESQTRNSARKPVRRRKRPRTRDRRRFRPKPGPGDMNPAFG